MNLSEALQIRPGVTAIIGGGGKTTLMERLAHELSGKARVIVCTTTHIYPEKTMPCLVSPAQAEIAAALEKSPCICVGAWSENGKFGPPELPVGEGDIGGQDHDDGALVRGGGVLPEPPSDGIGVEALIQKLIKAHLRIYLVAVPVMSVIGMHGNCIISLRFQNICHSILRSPDIQFIRNTARRKKRNTVSGKYLILRSCCSATVSGHMQTSMCYIFINTVNIRQYFHI